MVDPIDWSHPPPNTGQYPLSSTYCTVQCGLQITRLNALSEHRTCDLRNARPTHCLCGHSWYKKFLQMATNGSGYEYLWLRMHEAIRDYEYFRLRIRQAVNTPGYDYERQAMNTSGYEYFKLRLPQATNSSGYTSASRYEDAWLRKEYASLRIYQDMIFTM